MHGYNSAYRTVLGLAILYVLWMMIPYATSYANLVIGGTRRLHSQRAEASGPKMSAADLEAQLRRNNQWRPNVQLRCVASRDWDYVCSHLPVAQVATWLHFGVNVDGKRYLKVSKMVPLGTAVPGPR